MVNLGVIGLGTMGANLARNAARNGATVAVYNRTTETMSAFISAHGGEESFVACKTLKELVAALKPPRAILLMVKAGEAVDAMIADLLPLLAKNDILIDAGNSHYRDTERRQRELEKKGIRFIGMGVSGGEEGALKGPSMMPGGDRSAYDVLEPLLTNMAADDGAQGKCVAYIGPGGSGHFVKMVHNGIEYGIMQLIAESYDLLKNAGMTNAQLADAFASWNSNGEQRSFLLEITAQIFRTKDPETGKDLLDVIRDRAGQKGTGKWTTEAAMNYGFCIPTINAAVDARILSGCAGCREGWKGVPAELSNDSAPADWTEHVRHALSLSTITAYMQGLTLLGYASEAEKWDLQLGEIARIWRGGCIIRSALLPILQDAYGKNPEKGTTAIRKRFAAEAQRQWRSAVAHGVGRGVPLPAMLASLAFYDGMRRERLPQNLIQAQRDFFGAHGVGRTDREGTFHYSWNG
ncbi:MAG: 6-phosphogluconate dehydrogenase [Candidatus Peregrinibacteria bacterium Gr01-1014_25]|nr:MAG: 6-phosphogluconate dehydrogenase [Candidatus Peregrinibacteria bacterium Gr01-1014_25]